MVTQVTFCIAASALLRVDEVNVFGKNPNVRDFFPHVYVCNFSDLYVIAGDIM